MPTPNVDLTAGDPLLTELAESLRTEDPGRFLRLNIVAECQLGCLATAELDADTLNKARTAVALQINFLVARGVGTSDLGDDVTTFLKRERRGRQDLEYEAVAESVTARAGVHAVAESVAEAICADVESEDWSAAESVRTVRG